VNQGRQFKLALCLAVLAISGCQARSSVEAAQTAVTAAQTVVSESGVLPRLQSVLVGSNVEVRTSPDGATNDAVTDVTITATDADGRLAQIDPRARQAAVAAALAAAGQTYPNATISLEVVDGSGIALISGSKAPGEAPTVE
jgi:hypothetical protein